MRRNRFRNVVIVLAAGLACSGAVAQPRNDLCANAITIGVGAAEGTTVGAAPHGASSCGSSNTSPDVYYRFTAPASCQFEALTCDGNTNYDTVISIHSACPATGANQIVCNNDGCGTPGSRAVFSATRGVTYMIRVAGSNNDFGNFTLIVRQLGRPINDTCAGANDIFGDTGSISADTTCAMSEGVQTCGQGNSTGSPNLYYRWTAPGNGHIVFDTCAGAPFHTYLSASTDCPHTNGNLVGCNRHACETGSIMEFGVVAGATYFIRVGGTNDERGPFTLSWSFSPGPVPNDTCNNPQPIGLGSVRGATFNASVSEGIGCFPFQTNDVYYRFTSPVDAFVTIDTCSPATTFDTVLSVHTACGGDSTRIACNDDTCDLSASVTFPATAGQDYIIRVAGYDSNGHFVLNVTSDVQAIVFDPSTLGEYYLLRDNKSIAEFRNLAVSLGGYMASIGSFSEAQFVSKAVMQHNNVVRSVAIGLSDEQVEGTFHWDSNERLDYTLFLDGQPDNFNNGEDYCHILDPVSGVWNDYPGTAFPTLFGAAESDRRLLGWTESPNSDHFYLLFQASSWKGAQARARAMGGDLIVINDAEENDLIQRLFGGSVRGNDLWIGMSDAASEGFFRSVDGTTPTYTNFMAGEPNNFGGNEDYVEMNSTTGLWNDVTNLQPGSPNHGVAELVLPHVIGVAHGPGGCGTYALLSASSFHPAYFASWYKIAHVVNVDNAQENEFIRSAFAAQGGGRRIWLNANDMDEEGKFVWFDYGPVSYSNFAPGEPDNANGNQDYVVMNPDGTWSDVSTLDAGPFFAVAELYCWCDWDASGTYTSQDLFDFLTAFFADQADINCDHITNSQDFFDFLICLLDSCD